ncbi:hypothetical protein FZM89_10655, partial [Enterococcus faecium]|nr:hypothetical protein [Enterococcus faecium]
MKFGIIFSITENILIYHSFFSTFSEKLPLKTDVFLFYFSYTKPTFSTKEEQFMDFKRSYPKLADYLSNR